jgi:hypothetical protein
VCVCVLLWVFFTKICWCIPILVLKSEIYMYIYMCVCWVIVLKFLYIFQFLFLKSEKIKMNFFCRHVYLYGYVAYQCYRCSND